MAETPAATKVAHLSLDERQAKGRQASDRTPLLQPLGVAPGRGPSRSRRPARGAGSHPGAGSGAGAAWPDDGLAVHLLPGRRQDHGGGPQGHAGGRPRCPAVRRRPPVELRPVRLPGTAPAVRPERLRRDPAGAGGVRREADGGEFYHRGPQQRILQGRRARGDAGLGAGLPGGDGRVRADADDGRLVCPPGRGRADGRDPQRGGAATKKEAKEAKGAKGAKGQEGKKEGRGAGEAGQAGREAGGEDRREGAHPGQPAGPVQARRSGRRAVPDRQPAAGHRAGPRPGRDLRPVPGRGRAG